MHCINSADTASRFKQQCIHPNQVCINVHKLTPPSHGEPHRSFSAIIGWKALADSIETFGQEHEFTKMVVDLQGKDPDDAFSSIPYEKGFIFLYYLEGLIGKDKWDTFIPHVGFSISGRSSATLKFQ